MLRKSLRSSLNDCYQGQSGARAFIGGVAFAVVAQLVISALRGGFLVKRIIDFKNLAIRTIFAKIVDKEVAKAAKGITFKQLKDETITESIPVKGMAHGTVLALAERLHNELDARYDTGELSGTVYHGGDAHTKFINDMMSMYQWTNPLHLDVFNAVRKMEAEVVEMVVRLFHGHSHRRDACGALTSGGTESIGMAVKTYRDWGRDTKGITEPNIVMPITAHPAFDKAGKYYGVRIIKVPVDVTTGRVDPKELAKYITLNTVAIVGSAPNFPYGAIDPIPALGQLAKSRGVGLHVDACLGGFVVQYMGKVNRLWERLVDFRVDGVTTISCDTHKFGYAPKGTSVVMYESRELRKYQYFALADWPGGIYASPGASGSKAGNIIAGTWAALLALGDDGYTDACRGIIETAQQMRFGIESIPGLKVLGDPEVSAVSFTSESLCIYTISDRLKAKGWKLNPLQFPSGIQFSLTLVHTRDGIMKRFLTDVAAVVNTMLAENEAIKAAGKPLPKIGDQGGTMYGSQQRVSDRSIIERVSHAFLDGYYKTRHEQPASDGK